MARLAYLWHIRPVEMLAMGDDANDLAISIGLVTALPLAMGIPTLQRVADFVTNPAPAEPVWEGLHGALPDYLNTA